MTRRRLRRTIHQNYQVATTLQIRVMILVVLTTRHSESVRHPLTEVPPTLYNVKID